MFREPPDSKEVYQHYSGDVTWLEEWERECLGGALTLLHEITAALKTLNFPERSTKLKDFQRSIGIERLRNDGRDLRTETRFVVDGSVHGLQRLLEELEVYEDEEATLPALPYRNDYASLPDVDPLFDRREVSVEWMLFFRRLVREYEKLDVEICKRHTSVTHIQSLCFHGYLLAVCLHQALSLCAFARAQLPADG